MTKNQIQFVKIIYKAGFLVYSFVTILSLFSFFSMFGDCELGLLSLCYLEDLFPGWLLIPSVIFLALNAVSYFGFMIAIADEKQHIAKTNDCLEEQRRAVK